MKTIILNTHPSVRWSHFIHYMQFLYWCCDKIFNNLDSKYFIFEPENRSTINYIKLFRKKISNNFPNVIFTNRYKYKDVNDKDIIEYKYSLPGLLEIGNFILNNTEKKGEMMNWFPNNNSEKIKNLFINTNKNYNNIKIGLVNRKKNRKLNNYKQLCNSIKKNLKMDVDITYFEGKSFDYQIKFFNDHKIIISPHGAQLCSIPFSHKGSLIIECCHEEWHPYIYFPGLSQSSNMYHVMICDNHSVFPTWWSKEYVDKKRKRSNNSKLNIKITKNKINKIINIIKVYLKNNNKLNSKDCYLV